MKTEIKPKKNKMKGKKHLDEDRIYPDDTMKLKEYLKCLKTYAGDNIRVKEGVGPGGATIIETIRPKLYVELGIYDNFSMLLNANYKEFVRHFKGSLDSNKFFSRKYNFLEGGIIEGKFPFKTFYYGLTKSKIDVSPLDFSHWSNLLTDDYPEYKHRKFQEKHFNLDIMLHFPAPDFALRLSEAKVIEDMAKTVEDVCNYAIKRNLPICIPNANKGYHHPRIIYHNIDTSSLEKKVKNEN